MKSILLAASLALAITPAFAKDGTGSFQSFKKYKVTGKATVKGTKLTLSGFKTSSGPDLYVYVGNGSATREVATLKATSGNQTYTVPAGNFTSVFIHCKRHNSTFGRARLN